MFTYWNVTGSGKVPAWRICPAIATMCVSRRIKRWQPLELSSRTRLPETLPSVQNAFRPASWRCRCTCRLWYRCPLLTKGNLLTSIVFAQGEAQSKVACDAETKICYSSYSNAESGITIGVALPKNVTDPFNSIIKITAPVANKWVGFAWGGQMVWNPLTVAWANGSSGVASNRFALYVKSGFRT